MVLSSVVQWWEEWQLRILVLSSLGFQFYLAMFASARKKHSQALFRFSIWLAYLGGDALAIYALATLFNRQRKLRYSYVNGNHDLEVLWAPILLMHLGGQINISAYNIEDNELWSRHVLTAMAQVTVAIYVFFKSWSSADRRLLAAAILIFIVGIFKCFDKPTALKRASFNSIVTTFNPAPRTKTEKREVELEKYIQEARNYVQQNQRNPPALDSDSQSSHLEHLSMPDKLFVDYAYVYGDRLTTLKSFWLLDEKTTYNALSLGLSKTFNLIYSKVIQGDTKYRTMTTCGNIGVIFSGLILFLNLVLPIMPIALFHASHKNAYRGADIKVTFILLYITYFLEILSFFTYSAFLKKWSDGVAQCSLVELLAWNRKHKRLMGKGLLGTYFGLRPCHSSRDITMLVREHVKTGWMSHITDIESYWRFSDTRGQWALERNGGGEIFQGSIEKPFDESIILWHVATDLCFYRKGMTSHDSECAMVCRQISNYMMHLLFSNPEMLLPGSRRNLFTVAYKELKAILKGDDLSVLDERRVRKEGFIRDSWFLAKELMTIGDEKKMWEVIQAVWIEMLCFSAGRCRGYLHAKSLGSGGEYLSLVALLLSHAGLETYAERQQRVHLRLPKEDRVKIAKQRIQEAASNQATQVREEENATTPLASQVDGQLVKQQDDAASTSASTVECVAPAPVIKIVVSP